MIKYMARGNDGFYYAVFDCTDDAYDYSEKYDLEIACFNGYENACKLPIKKVDD